MNGRLDKVAMTNRLMQLKRELHYKCEIGEKGKWEIIIGLEVHAQVISNSKLFTTM